MSQSKIVFIKGIAIEMSCAPFGEKGQLDTGRKVTQTYDVVSEALRRKRGAISIDGEIEKRIKLNKDIKFDDDFFLTMFNKAQELLQVEDPPLIMHLKAKHGDVLQQADSVNGVEFRMEGAASNLPVIEKSNQIQAPSPQPVLSEPPRKHEKLHQPKKSEQICNRPEISADLIAELQKLGGFSYRQRKFLQDKNIILPKLAQAQHRTCHPPARKDFRAPSQRPRNFKPAPKPSQIQSYKFDVEAMKKELPNLETVRSYEPNWVLCPLLVENSIRKKSLYE
jgi:hypothetical protein